MAERRKLMPGIREKTACSRIQSRSADSVSGIIVGILFIGGVLPGSGALIFNVDIEDLVNL
jgi:hypothetical protein